VLDYKTMLQGRENVVTASSDMGGFFANPERVQHLYWMAKLDVNIELLLMPYQIFYLNQLAKGRKIPFEVGGFHGQLGTPKSYKEHEKGLGDWLLINLFDTFLPNTVNHKHFLSSTSTLYKVEMAAQSLKKDLYLNVHQDSVESNFRYYLAASILISNLSHLAIENGPGSKDVEKSKVLIQRMKDSGASRVEGTFDLVHAIVGLLHGAVPDMTRVSETWNSVLRSMDQNFTRIHLPIGKNAGDSLPIMAMIKEKKMLKDLGDIVRARGIRVTLENQQSLLFGVTDVWAEVERLKTIRDGLQESGIIK